MLFAGKSQELCTLTNSNSTEVHSVVLESKSHVFSDSETFPGKPIQEMTE